MQHGPITREGTTFYKKDKGILGLSLDLYMHLIKRYIFQSQAGACKLENGNSSLYVSTKDSQNECEGFLKIWTSFPFYSCTFPNWVDCYTSYTFHICFSVLIERTLFFSLMNTPLMQVSEVRLFYTSKYFLKGSRVALVAISLGVVQFAVTHWLPQSLWWRRHHVSRFADSTILRPLLSPPLLPLRTGLIPRLHICSAAFHSHEESVIPISLDRVQTLRSCDFL